METSLVPVHDGVRASDTPYFDVSHFSAVVFDVFFGHLLELTCFDIKVFLDFFHFEVRFRGSTKNLLSHLDLLLRFV